MSAGWTLQKQKRAKGLYFQAVCGKGADRRAVTLGYLSEVEAEAGLVRLRSLDAQKASKVVVEDNGPTPLVSDEGIRKWALDTSVEESIAEVEEAITRRQIESGDFARMALKDFVKHVWGPVRARGWSAPGSKKQHGAETAAKTWEREEHLWKGILRVIGDVAVSRLDADKWSRVLAGNPGWKSHRTKVLAQNAYRVMLKFCVHRKILTEMHPFDVILGEDEEKREVTPLLPEEAARLLAAASAKHRALWILSLGNGFRVGEAKSARWENLSFETGEYRIPRGKTAGAKRSLPLTEDALTAMRTYWIEVGRPTEGWCFPSDSESGHIEDLRGPILTAAKRAGVNLPRLTPNALRHSFGSICAIKSVPKVITRALMGHSARSEMLERYYEHARTEQLVEGMRSFPSLGAAAAK